MDEALQWMVNGEPAASVALDDRGLAYGDGLFETIAVRSGAARLLDYHFDRLRAGCRVLAIPLAPDEDRLRGEITRAAQGLERGLVKVIVTRGPGPRGYLPPAHPRPTRIVGSQPVAPAAPEPGSRGIIVRRCQTPISENRATAGLKTLGRLDHVLARAEWRDDSAHEGLMAASDGRVICGTMSNLFVAFGDTLITPALSSCGVAGVMRRLVIEVAAAHNIGCREGDIRWPDLPEASEMFMTNSQFGIWPVRRIERRDIASAPGPLTRRLIAALAERGVIEGGR